MFRWLLVCLVLSGGAFAGVKYGVPYLQAHNVIPKAEEGTSDDPSTIAYPPSNPKSSSETPDVTQVPEGPRTSYGRNLTIQEGRLTVTDRQEVPAEHEGSLTVIGTEIQPGEKISERERIVAKVGYLVIAIQPGEQVRNDEVIPFPAYTGIKQRYRRWKETDPLKEPGQEVRREGEEARAPFLIVAEENREFKRLKVGDSVKARQMVALVDPTLAIKELSSKYAQINAAEAEVLSSRKTKEETLRRYKAMLDANRRTPGSVSLDDVEGGRLQWQRYAQEEIAKDAAVRKAQQELLQAATILQKHEVRASIDGIVTNLYKNLGESVKNLDPIMQLQNPRHLRIEGLMEVQDVHGLSERQIVYVEPSRPEQPRRELRGHHQEVTCIAVSAGAHPVIVSGSEDRSARGWDPKTGELWTVWHQVPARAVACTPTGAKRNLALVGWADGAAWFIDLDNLKEKPRPLAERHSGAVTCVAFSPNGELCATGSDDRSICLWETDSGKLLDRQPRAHKNGLTSLQFATGTQLISAARDNTMAPWSVEPGNRLVRAGKESDRRSGDVAQLGVSPDGQRVLFDQGKELRVVSLADRQIVGTVQNPPGSPNFTTMALFSPDGKTILTNVAAENKLQLWRAPDGVTPRAAELRQFVWAPSAATCGAFAPDGSFAVTGTQDNRILVWPMPSHEEIDKKLEARLSLIEPLLQGATRQVRVWAELDNPLIDVGGKPTYLLTPGGTATVVVPQK